MIEAMVVLLLVGVLSQRARKAIGTWGTRRYQLWLAGLLLVLAALRARGYVVVNLRTSGLLGQAATDPDVAELALVAGSAATLGLGWLVAKYGFQTRAERGWLFFLAADLTARLSFGVSSAWRVSRPSALLDGWPFVVDALVVVASAALLILLFRAVRRIPLRRPIGEGPIPGGARPDVLPVHLLIAGGLLPALTAATAAYGVSYAVELVHGALLMDPAFSGLVFLFGIGSVFLLRPVLLIPEDVAANLQRYDMRILGIRPGPPTIAYLRRRFLLVTSIGAPCFALLLAAPQLVELLLPWQARVGLYGVNIMILVTIIYGLVSSLGETTTLAGGGAGLELTRGPFGPTGRQA